MTAAYDYDKQEWIEEETDAKAEAMRQIEQEIKILSRPNATDYLPFFGSTDTPAQASAKLRAQLSHL